MFARIGFRKIKAILNLKKVKRASIYFICFIVFFLYYTVINFLTYTMGFFNQIAIERSEFLNKLNTITVASSLYNDPTGFVEDFIKNPDDAFSYQFIHTDKNDYIYFNENNNDFYSCERKSQYSIDKGFNVTLNHNNDKAIFKPNKEFKKPKTFCLREQPNNLIIYTHIK